MPLPLTAGTVKVTLQGRTDGQVTINTLWFTKSGGAVTPSDVNAVATAVGNWYAGTVAPLLADSWSAEIVQAQDMSVGFGAVAQFSLGPTPGGVATEQSPNNVACCVSLRTGSAGRGFRGRNYVPAIPNAAIDINTLDPTFIASIITAYNDLLPGGAVDLGGFTLSVVSHYLNNVLRGAGLSTPVTSVVLTVPYVRSMRTREVGKGK